MSGNQCSREEQRFLERVKGYRYDVIFINLNQAIFISKDNMISLLKQTIFSFNRSMEISA